jgi:hypothetical protein
MSVPAQLGKLLNWKWGAVLGALLAVSLVAVAADGDEGKKSSRVPKPHVVIEKGDKCVEDEAFMKRNHMKLLMHQRDETMHKGIRTTKYSLQNCIDCHASRKNNSVLGSNDNFCQGCHSYVAVKIDCFECHSSKPKPVAARAVAAGHGAVVAANNSGVNR